VKVNGQFIGLHLLQRAPPAVGSKVFRLRAR
jgi:hypothetical protein